MRISDWSSDVCSSDLLRDMFEVDLVADAGARGNRLEIVEALRPPFQKVVPFAVAIIFDLDILLERLGMTEFIDHARVVDDEVDGDERVDLRRVAAESRDRIEPRGEVDHTRNAGYILQQQDRKSTRLNSSH